MMMARMPGARWLGEHSPQRPMQRYDIVCLHTIVGFAPAHAAHFSTHHDGTIDQSRDTRFQSGANLEGNPRVIAIENEDHGPAFGNWDTNDGHAVPAFTDAQVEANAQILAWAHITHGIPLQLCPNSKSTSLGLAYHRQGIDGNFADYAYPGRVAGGETWTESRGKVCPGDRRISARNEILARAKQIVEGVEDEMELTDNLTLSASTQALINAATVSVDNAMENGLIAGVLLKENLDDILTTLAAILAAVNVTPPGSTVVSGLTDEALVAVADAVAMELGQRLHHEEPPTP